MADYALRCGEDSATLAEGVDFVEGESLRSFHRSARFGGKLERDQERLSRTLFQSPLCREGEPNQVRPESR